MSRCRSQRFSIPSSRMALIWVAAAYMRETAGVLGVWLFSRFRSYSRMSK
jgi:hypothetical protein